MAEIRHERYEELRPILEKQNRITYTFEEVKEIGDGLIHCFILLMVLDSEEDDNPDKC